jgi:hypothetical protein
LAFSKPTGSRSVKKIASWLPAPSILTLAGHQTIAVYAVAPGEVNDFADLPRRLDHAVIAPEFPSGRREVDAVS